MRNAVGMILEVIVATILPAHRVVVIKNAMASAVRAQVVSAHLLSHTHFVLSNCCS